MSNNSTLILIFTLSCLLGILLAVNVVSFEHSAMYMALLILGLLSIPKIITSIARPIWNLCHRSRYDRKRALRGFVGWWKGDRCGLWKGFAKNKSYENGDINIVYGHTHLLDLLPYERAMKISGKTKTKEDLLLINIPSWVSDSDKKHKDVLNDIFLYIDEERFELFGWDEELCEPYYITKDMVTKMGDRS